jgi:hypothetical protein
VQAKGAAMRWGRNAEGRSAPPAGRFQTLSAGDTHACAVDSARARVVCWGRARAARHDYSLAQVPASSSAPSRWPASRFTASESTHSAGSQPRSLDGAGLARAGRSQSVAAGQARLIRH